MKDKINEFQRSGMLAVHNYSEIKGEKINVVCNRLIDWLLYNLDEIDKNIKEQVYLGAATITSGAIGSSEIDIMEKNILEIDDAKKIIRSVKNTIENLDERQFDIYIGRYHNKLVYKEIANFEEINEMTVKRAIKEIRQEVEEGFNREDITFDSVLTLRKKLNSIKLKEVS
jgi:hypothetical protein